MEEKIEILKSINDDWIQSEFFSAATDSQIEEFEKNMKVKIPKSYKDFLRKSNGAKLLGGDCCLYSVNPDDKFKVNYDFSEGKVPKELLIVGFDDSSHICYDSRYNSFIIHEYEDYDDIKEECAEFSDFCEVLDYFIDIATN